MKIELDISRLQTGDIILQHDKFNIFDPATYYPLITRYATKSRYNHAGIVMEFDGLKFVAESLINGVNIREIEVLQGKDIAIYRNMLYTPRIFKEEAEEILEFLFKAEGKKYDFKDALLSQGLYCISYSVFKNDGLWVGSRRKNAEKTYYCSELVARALIRSYPNNWWKCSPADLIRWSNNIKLFEGVVNKLCGKC